MQQVQAPVGRVQARAGCKARWLAARARTSSLDGCAHLCRAPPAHYVAAPRRFVVCADLELGGTVQLPKACPSNREKPCTCASFRWALAEGLGCGKHVREAHAVWRRHMYRGPRLPDPAGVVIVPGLPHTLFCCSQAL